MPGAAEPQTRFAPGAAEPGLALGCWAGIDEGAAGTAVPGDAAMPPGQRGHFSRGLEVFLSRHCLGECRDRVISAHSSAANPRKRSPEEEDSVIQSPSVWASLSKGTPWSHHDPGNVPGTG